MTASGWLTMPKGEEFYTNAGLSESQKTSIRSFVSTCLPVPPFKEDTRMDAYVKHITALSTNSKDTVEGLEGEPVTYEELNKMAEKISRGVLRKEEKPMHQHAPRNSNRQGAPLAPGVSAPVARENREFPSRDSWGASQPQRREWA